MHVKPKMVFRLFYMALFITLWSCEQEKDFIKVENNKAKIKISYVNSIALKKNNELMRVLNNEKIIKPTLNSKIVTDTINGFSINTDKVKFTQGDNFNSYTFELIEQEDGYLDNLVVMSQSDGSYIPYILRYSLTDEEKSQLDSNVNIDFTGKTKVLKLNHSNILSHLSGKINYTESCSMV